MPSELNRKLKDEIKKHVSSEIREKIKEAIDNALDDFKDKLYNVEDGVRELHHTYHIIKHEPDKYTCIQWTMIMRYIHLKTIKIYEHINKKSHRNVSANCKIRQGEYCADGTWDVNMLLEIEHTPSLSKYRRVFPLCTMLC